jgi:hypothetical protein
LFKVTVFEQDGQATFRVEGRLVKPWVRELRKSWSEFLREHPEEPIRVDLGEVTFIDQEGKQLLSLMFRKGADLWGGGFLTRSIVELIKSERK